MQSVAITSDLSVAPQPALADLAEAAAAGVRSIINNRPDGESFDQPSSSEVEAEAKRLGLDYRYIPIVSGRLGPADVDAFASALREMPGPVIAFCRSGTRSATVWALAKAGELGTEAVIEKTAAAGYDLQPMRPILEAFAAREQG
jgi:sulfide:quinone oxidoreductase